MFFLDLVWDLGHLVHDHWRFVLGIAGVFAAYACLRWKGVVWKIAAMIPLICLLGIMLSVSKLNNEQIGPGVGIGLLCVPVIVYCVVLAAFRIRKRIVDRGVSPAWMGPRR